ncbi:MAG: Transcriptional regulatory protein WalR [Firmicutes bacterium ADurb.Bin182]|nr:MAG: Transcriptional regulatory protein WalR [Firmicutes bacterium ADurb.Bin182]
MYKVLIVEDEKPISNLIKMNLESSGFLCQSAYNGSDAADLLEIQRFDLVLLDVMLPKVDGFELMEYIAPTGAPVIFLTAKADVKDRVKGLNLGADDYIVKPFAISELLARVDAVIRRYYKADEVICLHDIEIRTQSHTVKRAGKQVELTPKEYDLLMFFVQNRSIALFRDVIFERVWQCSYLGDSRTVDLHVQRLRRKLNWEGKLKTVYKIGYMLEGDA